MSQPETSPAPTEYCGVRCTETYLAEIANQKILLKVDRKDIARVTLRYGLQAANPMTQTIFGVLLAALGYYPVTHLINWLKHGGTVFTMEIWVIPLALIGCWLILQAYRQGYYLDIDESHGPKKVTFQRKADLAGISGFLERAEKQFALKVVREV